MPAATVSSRWRFRADSASRATGWSRTREAERMVPTLDATISAAMMPSRIASRPRWIGTGGALAKASTRSTLDPGRSLLSGASAVGGRRHGEVAMKGLMQDVPLTLVHIFERPEKYFGAKGIVTATGAGRIHTSYAEWADRTRRLGGVLDTLGISADGRVATFGWNTGRHLELYFAAPCTGRVLHTLNIRLFPEQLTYIVNHAEDEVIFVDRSLLGLITDLLPGFETVRHLVVMDDGKGDVPSPDGGFALHDYEELLANADPVDFQVDDELRAASMCYTSGTTGNPKGVVYSHRSSFLHSFGAML